MDVDVAVAVHEDEDGKDGDEMTMTMTKRNESYGYSAFAKHSAEIFSPAAQQPVFSAVVLNSDTPAAHPLFHSTFAFRIVQPLLTHTHLHTYTPTHTHDPHGTSKGCWSYSTIQMAKWAVASQLRQQE